MNALRLTVLAATIAYASAQQGTCEVCHLHYYHKDVSHAETWGSDVSICKEYEHEACCTKDTVKKIDQNSKLYGDYDLEACGLSSSCKKYFIEESCFYECDRNVGKWRKHVDCDDAGEDNGWEIKGMPVKASYWDAWYDACKDEYFAWGPGGGYWDLPKFTADSYKGTGAAKTKTAYTSCEKFSDTYKNGTMVAEVMWGGAFTYEKDESKAYVMTFPDGTANPNNALFTDKEYPRECAGHEVNLTHPGVDVITGNRVSYSEVACPIDWHKQPNAGVSDRSSRGTLTCDKGLNTAKTELVSGTKCKASGTTCPATCKTLLDEVETECFGMEFTYTPVGGTETYGKWNTDKLAWYNAADAERVKAKKEDACDAIIDQYILAATPSPADIIRAPLMAIMGFVVAALLVIA